MELSQPFVQLPYRFDVAQLQMELARFNESTWMEHPSRLSGNTAIPLISLHGGDNDDFCGSMQPSPHLDACEYMQQVMASFDEVLARSRLMRLAAGAEVSPHIDFNYHWYSRVRIHIPIVTNPHVIFHCGDEQRYMQAGECWIFDSWREHKVVNRSDHERVHLVIDVAGSSRFWKVVRQMQLADDTQKPKTKILEYRPQRAVTLKTERYNNAPVMAPGELDALSRELITDLRGHPENDALVLAEYAQLLDDLSNDWRELWHLYGYENAGWPHYKGLLDRTVKRLRPNPRALITKSNGLGVNPIIMQRILRAALNVEQAAAFRQS
jgi:hypothetical protein